MRNYKRVFQSPSTQKEVSFKVDQYDQKLIFQIADRAVALARKLGFTYSVVDATMDLTACHANGTRLRLASLLAADEGNFGHDVFGIRKNLDRDTGKLGGFFLPRFTVRKGAK